MKKLITQEVNKQLSKEKRDAKKAFASKVKGWIPIQSIIGITAVIILYNRYGFEALEKTILEWTIGVTVVAFIVTHLVARQKN